MHALGSLLKGMSLGAGLMYLFDPDRGRRRRALVRDQFVHACHQAEDFLDAATRDACNRAHGWMAEVQHLFEGGHEVRDDVLEARVRAELGRAVSHPRAIEVMARQGHVTLSGPILAGEVEQVFEAVAAVRGVRRVDDRFAIHEQPGDLPDLQGGEPRTGRRPELWQGNWSPATKLAVGLAGGLLALRAVGGRGMPLLALGAAGLYLATRDPANRPGRPGRLRGTRRGQVPPWEPAGATVIPHRDEAQPVGDGARSET